MTSRANPLQDILFFQASELFFSPAPERAVNSLPRGAQVFRDRLGHPPIGMHPDVHTASLCWVCDLVKAGKPARSTRGLWTIRQYQQDLLL